MSDFLPGGISTSTPPGSAGLLPEDLARVAARRLGVACLVWAFLWSFALLMNNVVGPLVSPDAPLDDAWPWPGNPVAAAVIVVSLGIFAYTRSDACDCRLSLELGLLYEVGLAFAIGLVNQWTPNTFGLSWICVLVIIHPMIVPNTKRKTLITALVAASMDPVGLAITKARGVPVPTLAELVWVFLPNYICAFLAVLPSHILSHLGREVREARELGSYRLGELLGRGGMGEVYRARHRLLHRPAAVKLIRRESQGSGRTAEATVHRFRREAEAAARLSSPHTISLYDFGMTDEGDYYYVMELLHGLDLEVLVHRFGPAPPARTVRLLRQACGSLAEAHARGLVHRDVKPANLLTCWVGLEADFLKVLDFGLVKGRLADLPDLTKLTNPKLATGTPAYLPPELARGDPVDSRTDIYSLGCVAYWLLTGQLVFEGDTPIEIIAGHLQDVPVPPSRRSEFEIHPSLDELILACLEKDPRLRPQSAEELDRRLAACEMDTTWSRETAVRWWKMNVPELIPAGDRSQIT